MCPLSIQLFGEFSARYEDKILDGLDAAKVRELFCYLLLNRHRRHSRESLAALLWADSTTAQSKKNLRQVIWQLQCALNGEAQQQAPQLLLTTIDWIQLNDDVPLQLDVDRFEQAYSSVRNVRGRDLDAARAATVDEALRLYRGDLLQGWYQDWCLARREQLESMYLAMLDRLMGYSEAHEAYDAGLAYGALALRHDHAHERTHRQMMRLHYLAGDRTAALRQFERCAAALREELGVKPASLTMALYQQIRADRLQAEPLPAESGGDDGNPASLGDMLERLRQLQSSLTEFRNEILREVRALELALTGTRR